MYNTTSNGVRRAHSFDSYDNLDRWQAMREYRMQFLSTRAKFDKAPPSQPPPTPPPRRSSKFKVISSVPPPLSTSSSVNSWKQDFKKEDTFRRESEILPSLSWSRNEEDSSYLSTNEDTFSTANKGDSSITNQSKIDKSHNDDQNKFQVLKSPGNVLKITQSWQKYTEDSEEINVLKPTPQSVLEPEATPENKIYIEEVNEPVMVRKKVERLQYQEPTFFKDVNIPSVSQHPNKLNLSSNYHDPSIHYLNSFGVKKVQKAFIPSSETQYSFLKNDTESSQSDFTYRIPNQHLSNSSNGTKSKNEVTLQMPLSETSWRPKNNTQDNNRTYLESSLKMFAESLLDQGDSSSVYSNDLHVGRPRRISTGSMHEPTVWRSQSTTSPVKSLVKKFSKN